MCLGAEGAGHLWLLRHEEPSRRKLQNRGWNIGLLGGLARRCWLGPRLLAAVVRSKAILAFVSERQVVGQTHVKLLGSDGTLSLDRSELGPPPTPADGDIPLNITVESRGFRAADQSWIVAPEWNS